MPEEEKAFYRRYLHRDGSNVSWDLIWGCWGSVAVFSLAPLQDFLGLGNEARMNYPGNPSGNWGWRMPDGRLDESLEEQVQEINYLYGRDNQAEEIEKEPAVPDDYFDIPGVPKQSAPS